MIKKAIKALLFIINLLRGIPAYLLVCLSGAKDIVCLETEEYLWTLEDCTSCNFFYCFNLLMNSNDIYRTQVQFRCSAKNTLCAHALGILYPGKKDMELIGDIGEGLVVFHGHGTVVGPHHLGKDFKVYQGVTVGRNPKPGQEICQPIIGDNVEVFANAIVAGGITIGDNVSIGAGAVVMKDVPANSVAYGNPCVIRPKRPEELVIPPKIYRFPQNQARLQEGK